MKRIVYGLGLLFAGGRLRLARAGLGLAWRLARAADLAHFEALAVHLHRLGLKADARALAERLLARSPDSRPARSTLAIVLFEEGALEAATGHFARLDAQEAAGAPVETRLVAQALMDPVRAARGEPYVATLDDVLVDTGYWSVIDGARLYAAETHGRTMPKSPLVRHRATADHRRMVITLPAPVRTIEAPCILLGGDDNYSHWLIRNLLKLSLLEPNDTRPLLVNEDLRGYQVELLEMLGIPTARLLPVPREALVRCRRLVVPVQLRNHARLREGIDWLRARLAPFMGAPSGRRLFASRADTGRRRMRNEDALYAALAPLGFERIVPGTLSVRAQIEAFSQAAVVVAPHGAALTNMLFAPPGAAMLELCNPATSIMAEFREIARAMGQRAVRIIAPPDPGEAKPQWNSEFEIEVAAAVAATRALL